MTKILHISTRHNVGGIGKLILELLSDKDFDQNYLTGVCGLNEKELPFEMDTKKYTLTRIQTLRREIRFINDISSLLKIRKVLRQERPDIVHTHMSKAGVLGRLAALSLMQKPKLIHSYHGHVLDGYFNKTITSIFTRIERLLGMKTEVFVFDGNQTRNELIALNIRPKLKQVVILPGLIRSFPSDKFYSARDYWGNILVVARIEQVKRIDIVLEVAAILKKDFPNTNFRITIVGDGSLRERLERTSREMALPIEFLGWKDNLDQEYKKASIFLSVSEAEGTPIAFMEAAAFGCPIVSTKVGSVEDLVDHNKTGILCGSDPNELAYTISKLIDSPNTLIELGHNARKKAEAEFGINMFLSEHANLYQGLLSNS